MKKIISSILILAIMNLWIPFASAEISQDLDPMASPESQMVTSESPVAEVSADQTSNVISTEDVAKTEKKIEKTKKEKSKKDSKKKSSDKKKKKTSSKGAKKTKKNSN